MMKKRIAAALFAIMLTACISGCGNDDVKRIERNESSGAQSGNENKDSSNGDEQSKLKGYVFETDGANGKVSMTTDIEMAGILEKLGEPDSYFEAESCAFKGLDKTYTYSHYEIQTYPDGDKDLISCILFKDDIISTKEGMSIGMTKEQMENTYGTGYEVKGNMYSYEKDGSYLAFIMQDDIISSIQYYSPALEKEQN